MKFSLLDQYQKLIYVHVPCFLNFYTTLKSTLAVYYEIRRPGQKQLADFYQGGLTPL